MPVLPVATSAPADRVADLLDAVAADPKTLVVASTDLSHYLSDAAARARDSRTLQAVVELRPEHVDPETACGTHALRGLLTWARRTPPSADRALLPDVGRRRRQPAPGGRIRGLQPRLSGAAVRAPEAWPPAAGRRWLRAA